jgi:OPA family sugar phosphate sensor protein UhpC-like MFS transporter
MCWVLNGWFQGMGFPPCARLLAHWFSKEERGRKWAIWNCSHQAGGLGISILAIYLGDHYGWRAIFIVPGVIALLTTLFILNRLRDTPESLGLPSVEVYTGAESATEQHHQSHHAPESESFAHILLHRVFSNPYIWLICLANFFVYIIRLGFFTWAIDYLSKEKHYPIGSLILMNASFEGAGLVGSLLSGWLTDRVFRGRRTPVCLLYLAGTAAAIFAMWKAPDGNLTWNL